jgi:hypothetical protein
MEVAPLSPSGLVRIEAHTALKPRLDSTRLDPTQIGLPDSLDCTHLQPPDLPRPRTTDLDRRPIFHPLDQLPHFLSLRACQGLGDRLPSLSDHTAERDAESKRFSGRSVGEEPGDLLENFQGGLVRSLVGRPTGFLERLARPARDGWENRTDPVREREEDVVPRGSDYECVSRGEGVVHGEVVEIVEPRDRGGGRRRRRRAIGH